MKLKSKVVAALTSAAMAVSLCGFAPAAALADGVVQGVEASDELPATIPFEATYNGEPLPVVSVYKRGYEYTEYGNPEPAVVDVYVVAVPVNCTSVDLAFASNKLVYNYNSTGELKSDFYPTDYLCVGESAPSVKVDIDGNGEPDFIQVQDLYKPDWTGGALNYAITFTKEIPTYVIAQRISSKTKAKALTKAAVDKKKRVVSFSVSGAQTELAWTLGAASKKAGLKVAATAKGKVKVTVPKGTKTGSYKLTVWAKEKAGEYKASNKLTLKVTVAKKVAVAV